jgi:hypothetical protein
VVLSATEPARMRLLIGFFDLRTRRVSTASVMTACGPSLPRTCATARPHLAKADTAFQAHSLVNRLNLA